MDGTNGMNGMDSVYDMAWTALDSMHGVDEIGGMDGIDDMA